MNNQYNDMENVKKAVIHIPRLRVNFCFYWIFVTIKIFYWSRVRLVLSKKELLKC